MFAKIQSWLASRPVHAILLAVLASLTGTVAVHKYGSFVPIVGPPGIVFTNGNNQTSNAAPVSGVMALKEGQNLVTGPIDAGTCTTLLVDPSIAACGEGVFDDFLVCQKILGDLTNAIWCEKLEMLGGGSCSSTAVLATDGGTAGAVTYGPVSSPTLIDASATITQPDAGLIAVQFCAPGTATTYGIFSQSEVHVLPAFQGTSTVQIDAGGHYVLAPNPNTLSQIVDSGSGGQVLSLYTTYGDMSPGVATGASFSNGVLTINCSPFTAVNEHWALCNIPNGIYDAGSNDASFTVSVASTTNPSPCAGCLTLAPSAPPPTITSIVPNTGSAAGGTPSTITGTGFIIGATTLAINGQAMTSVSCSSSTSCTATTPAYTGSATGSGATGYGVAVTTAGGTATGSTIPSEFWYTSSAITYDGVWQADTLGSGNASTWANQIAGHGDFTQGTGADQPSIGTGFNGGSLKYINCTGSPVVMNETLSPAISGGLVTLIFVAQYTSTSGSTNGIVGFLPTYSIGVYSNGTSVFASDLLASSVTMGSVDTSAHVFEVVVSASNVADTWIDSTHVSGTLHNNTGTFGSGTNTVCGANSGGPTYFGTSNIAYVAVGHANIPSTDGTNYRATLKAIYGTP